MPRSREGVCEPDMIGAQQRSKFACGPAKGLSEAQRAPCEAKLAGAGAPPRRYQPLAETIRNGDCSA
jgi:hypothetical protein